MKISTTYSLEIELALTATYGPPIPERGPTYASGGEPAEAASVEDVDIVGAGVVQSIYPRTGKMAWQTLSIMDGVNINSPDIQRLFANVLKIVGEGAEAVLVAEVE